MSTDLQQHLYPIDIYEDNYQKKFQIDRSISMGRSNELKKWPTLGQNTHKMADKSVSILY